MLYPMYVVPFDAFMGMKSVRAQQELRKDGTLVAFTADMGKVIFVSHQWVGNAIPDPDFKQLSILKEALQNLMADTTHISIHLGSQLFHGASTTITAEDLKAQPLFVWYDYFSCPQFAAALPGQDVGKELQKAISSIPAYVERSEFFMILAPSMRHADRDLVLGYSSWRSRGWCRAERAARALAVGGHQNRMVVVEGPTQLQITMPFESYLVSVGRGVFTQQSDKEALAPVMVQMVRTKLKDCLEKEDLRGYRLLLNLQGVLLRDLPARPVDGVVPREACVEARPLSAFAEEAVPTAGHARPRECGSGASDLAEWFLRQNGFAEVTDRDECGWSPLCYAALNGDPLLIQGLLGMRGDLDDRITKAEPRLHLEEGGSLLHICALYENNEALKLLIAEKAQVNIRDKVGTSPLTRAAVGDNVEGIRILLEGNCDLNLRGMLGNTALEPACAWGSANAAKFLIEAGLSVTGNSNGLGAIFFCVLFEGTPDVARCLVEATAACVNAVAQPPMTNRMAKLFAHKGSQYPQSVDKISRLGYHIFGASPLMVCILMGRLDIADILLHAKADLTLRNSRGRTAIELAVEASLPAAFVRRLAADAEGAWDKARMPSITSL